ncbi:hypothetical protein CO178_00185 [candidate division WWE3 bacterium CG_4_9_14_3_um_filter_34_6]|uniref:Uncharacterized protein n=1 Tax=candidate division WWE3 bacterium CG_4_9_14_3_um_filter_34_6 TaxID=1975079 RepID=A0A2M7X5J5_UNCKA|nr:MAG: hypothetical protein CO178_00185 [candidate division WWE3 bacterium CG_4_9_14_3_um_filter_34_6]
MSLAIISLSFVGLFQATSAAFEETVTVAGTSFSIASEFQGGTGPADTNTALKLFKNLAGGTDFENLTDTVEGMNFEDVEPVWRGNFPLKMYNKGLETLDIISAVNYISDVNTIRDDIYVQISVWDDANNNGVFEVTEEGDMLGYDTILRLRNDKFVLGEIAPGETKGFVMKFDGSGITQSNAGQSAVYDFTFTGVGM